MRVKFFKHSWLCWLGFAFDYYHASEGLCHVVKLLLTKQIRDYRNCNEDNGDGAVVLYFDRSYALCVHGWRQMELPLISHVQIFDKRTLVVTEREMDMYWKHLSQAYMTEESDDPDICDNIVQHKLPWRSQSKLGI